MTELAEFQGAPKLSMIPSALRTFSTSTRLSFPKLRRTPQKDKWTPALAPGVLPAYDEALALILKDANQKRAELEELKKQLESTSDSERNLILKRLEKLDIESEINVPEVRWNFRMGLCTFSSSDHSMDHSTNL
jgi:large subunit ribosomal protein L35